MPLNLRGNASMRLKRAGLILGVLFLIWLPFEDTDTKYVVPLAVALSVWLAAKFVIQRKSILSRKAYAGIGLLAGLAVPPIAVALLAFKGGLHAHGFPEFALVQVRDVLLSTPWWAAAGLLAGLVFGWWVAGTDQ